MADYFENMCIGIPLEEPLREEKLAWWKTVEEMLNRPYDDEEVQTFLESLGVPPEALECTIMQIEVGNSGVYLCDDGGVLQTDGVAAILQAYLGTFDPDGVICAEIAFTCSKHRVDGFGGCAMVVTATDVRFKTLNKAVDELMAELGADDTQVRTVDSD